MSMLLTVMLLQAAAAAPQATAEVAVASPPADAKIVCKTVSPTGSRLGGKRVCMSKAEWRRMNKENEEATRDIQDSHSKQGANQ